MRTVITDLTAPGTADRPHIAAISTSAEEAIAAIGFQARDYGPRGQVELLQHLARLRIDPPDVAILAFPGPVPELAVDPRHPGHEALALDGAEHRPGLRIDLVDFSLTIFPDPERAFRPGQSGIAPPAGRRDRAEHLAG